MGREIATWMKSRKHFECERARTHPRQRERERERERERNRDSTHIERDETDRQTHRERERERERERSHRPPPPPIIKSRISLAVSMGPNFTMSGFLKPRQLRSDPNPWLPSRLPPLLPLPLPFILLSLLLLSTFFLIKNEFSFYI